jgi:hypothetical protein
MNGPALRITTAALGLAALAALPTGGALADGYGGRNVACYKSGEYESDKLRFVLVVNKTGQFQFYGGFPQTEWGVTGKQVYNSGQDSYGKPTSSLYQLQGSETTTQSRGYSSAKGGDYNNFQRGAHLGFQTDRTDVQGGQVYDCTSGDETPLASTYTCKANPGGTVTLYKIDHPSYDDANCGFFQDSGKHYGPAK